MCGGMVSFRTRSAQLANRVRSTSAFNDRFCLRSAISVVGTIRRIYIYFPPPDCFPIEIWMGPPELKLICRTGRSHQFWTATESGRVRWWDGLLIGVCSRGPRIDGALFTCGDALHPSHPILLLHNGAKSCQKLGFSPLPSYCYERNFTVFGVFMDRWELQISCYEGAGSEELELYCMALIGKLDRGLWLSVQCSQSRRMPRKLPLDEYKQMNCHLMSIKQMNWTHGW